MGLACSVCRRHVDEGLNFCPNCRTGFASQLYCTSCGMMVSRGTASCPRCGLAPAQVPTQAVSLRPPPAAPPAAPGLPPHVVLPAPVQATYVSRSGGVEAVVQIPRGDAEVMDLMAQVVLVLHTFAARVNTLTGHSELTRRIIHSARSLATDVQEELELRKGPGR